MVGNTNMVGTGTDTGINFLNSISTIVMLTEIRFICRSFTGGHANLFAYECYSGRDWCRHPDPGSHRW